MSALPIPVQPALQKRTMTYNQWSSCPDMEAEFEGIYQLAKPYTMTSLERMYGLYQAVKYVVAAEIPGELVECGVWKGGSAMVVAATLAALGKTQSELWLYDTYSGMTVPDERDLQYDGVSAHERLKMANMRDFGQMAHVGVEEVRANLAKTGYPMEKIHFVQGDVLETIPGRAPARISLLRLDTDWYKSTAHERAHLYPRLARGGVLLIDDYGHWKGSRQAVDEYLATTDHLLLNRLDYTGRIGIKP